MNPILVALLLAAPATGPAAPLPAPHVLTLEDALKSAREHQPQLQQARAQSAAAAARADEARAPLLPQVSGSGSYQRTTENFAATPGSTPAVTARPSSSWNTVNYWRLSATASQLIWDFDQTSGRWRASQATAAAQRETERATYLSTLLTARSAFFAARAAKDQLGVARETVANQDVHLKQIEGFVAAGTRPAIDLAQARTDRANAEVQLIGAENGYATARVQLNQAMGLEGPADFDVADEPAPVVEGEDQPLDPLLDEALRNRPEMAALDQQLKAQQLTLGAVKGGYFPSLGVATGVTDAGSSLDALVWNWSATATLTWNFFQGGLTRAQEREASATLVALEAQSATERQQVRVEVDQARLAVRAARASVGAASEAVANARERLRLAEGRYRTGVGNAIELSDAQLALTQAGFQRVQADYNLATSRSQLLRALGREKALE
ncbi:TolC family protein [Anaeromyxobacter paludicola]|uniref:Outer membrane protein OprM n=1 Tax=Anaeromyxobacter paludicola TaxID=2918171 RepID=A0ABM7X7T5_9BACT|nr:TolC family protein [Anaeromyxobacter paludicola]BDG07893.1 outer membrane protein OprM [Anaeromyxobacter paludicola]